MLRLNSNRLCIITRSAVVLLVMLCIVAFTSCSQQEKRESPAPKARRTGTGQTQKTKSEIAIHNAIAVIETAKGEIEVEFFADAAPKTVENFIKNARLGYYNNELFHRVESGTLIQAGSRFVRDTTIPIETSDHQPIRGVLAMAKEEGATVAHAAEFFICLDTLELDGEYTLFGKVTKGLEVMDKIEKDDKISKIVIREKG
jgi:cyclophilin family peptidyl-prolyl cis-trans isomerase